MADAEVPGRVGTETGGMTANRATETQLMIRSPHSQLSLPNEKIGFGFPVLGLTRLRDER